MARTALLLLTVASIACGPAVATPQGGASDSDSAANGSSPGADADGSSSGGSEVGEVESGMLPPCEPWTLDVVIDDRESDPITDISFKEGSFVGTGLLSPASFVVLDDGYAVAQSKDVIEGGIVWDVFTDRGGMSGPFTTTGTAPDPAGGSQRVFFYAYHENTGNLIHLAHYHEAMPSAFEPVRLLRDSSTAGFVISGHRGVADAPILTTIRIDYDGTVMWILDHELASGTTIGTGDATGGADLFASGDLVQLTADAARLRLVRTALAGEIVWDEVLDVEARPVDVRTLPDGDILVLARTDVGARLLRLDGDANVTWTRDYATSPSALGVSELGDAAILAGGTLDDDGSSIVVVDEAGEIVFEHLGDLGTPSTFHRAVYDSRFFVTARDRAWVAQIIPHAC